MIGAEFETVTVGQLAAAARRAVAELGEEASVLIKIPARYDRETGAEIAPERADWLMTAVLDLGSRTLDLRGAGL
ncbi:hypothetical protein [Pseudonocardia sp. NPDC049154]|uniref:hypothetical protein n=1 Tax=Pseudonocardia sp. NPDC049154 TaxID=3155501 RepID=UPI0034089CA9